MKCPRQQVMRQPIDNVNASRLSLNISRDPGVEKKSGEKSNCRNRKPP
jgi:hypothetical protein